MSQASSADVLLQLADRCVKCGMCLPSCPTYGLFQNEAESPRGRISLVQAVAQQSLQATPSLRHHLEHCLGCRTCEKICPAQMAYGQLLDRVRADWRTPPSFVLRQLLAWAASPVKRQRWRRLLSGLQRLGLLTPVMALGRKFRRDIPRLSPQQSFASPQTLYPSVIEPRGKVMLFTGCTGPDFDAETLRVAIKLLTHLGYVIDVPNKQNCCGAMHLHSGDTQTALDLARQNIAAFSRSDTPIIYIASGCGAQLKEYADLPWDNADDQSQAAAIAERATEITQFVTAQPLPSHLSMTPLKQTIAVYTPCSMRNVLRQVDASTELLGQIPGVDLQVLPNSPACCGAAGTYMLTQSKLAGQIRQPHLENLRATGAQILTTTNIGCALHLASGAEQMGMKLTVKHPVTLFAEQLQFANSTD